MVVNVNCCVNVALAVVFALIAKVQTGFVLPAHGPVQLVNTAFAPGIAVNVIEVPDTKLVPVGAC